MRIRVTIKAGSKAAKIIEQSIAEKKAFRAAVDNASIKEYAKENLAYFCIPS